MIISLEEAQAISRDYNLIDVLAIEQQIRQLTNNNFHHEHIRVRNIAFVDNQIISANELIGFNEGDTIEIIGTKYNDGLYFIENISDEHVVTVQTVFKKQLVNEATQSAEMVLVEYPYDVVVGVKDVLAYKSKMKSKQGIKSERISRVQVTYNDTDNSNIDGVPSSLFSFLKKYRKIRWG